MKHLGDITKINGAEAPRVEVVIGGSPCQDLSVAGRRAGLAGERSGLFMEQIRIIKEARRRDESVGKSGADVFPRFMVWENVPGAFSSQHGEDFRAVLEETVRIVEPDAVIPRYEGGAWKLSGVIMGDRWSVAWRVHDAQFWGVPQRRRRICMVADFAGQAAPWIVFDLLWGETSDSGSDWAVGHSGGAFGSEVRFIHESLSGYPSESGKARKRITSSFAQCAYPSVSGTLKARMDGSPMPECGSGAPIVCIQGNCIDRADTAGCNGRGWNDENVSYTLNTIDRPEVVVPQFVENHPADSRVRLSEDGICQTLSSRMGTGGGNVPMVLGFKPNQGEKARGLGLAEELCQTLNTSCDSAVCIGMDVGFLGSFEERSGTLLSRQYKDPPIVTYQNVWSKIMASDNQKNTTQEAAENKYIVDGRVRRITPLECERLQGYPDGWTDIGEWTDSKGKKHQSTDACRYKALGNSIALPFWRKMLDRMISFCQSGTMASLFDGIGGFPLCWAQVGGETLWASEIEEFPIAVTQHWFGDAEGGTQ